MKRRTLLQLGASAALARPAIAQDLRPRTLLFVPQSNLTDPDPVWTTAAVVHTHAFLIYDTLYGLDASGVEQPQMLAGHTISDDGRRWTLTLRDGLRFHDGTAVRAADAAASIARWAHRDPLGQQLLLRGAEITAQDDRRIRIALDRPFPRLAFALGAGNCFVMPERIAQTDPFKQITEFVGSGPWRFVPSEWVAGIRTVYSRFDGYQPRPEPPSATAGGKIAHFDRIEWQVMPDPATAVAALQNGEVDWVEQPLFDLLDVLGANRKIRLDVFNPLGRIGLIALNHLYPPFNNPEIRRAVLSAVDQSELHCRRGGCGHGAGPHRRGLFHAGTPLANTEGMAALIGPRDIAAARKRIASAGYAGEPVLVMAPADIPSIQALSQVTAELFKSLGMNVRYESMDWGSLVTRRANHNPPDKGGWNAFCTTWTGLGMSNPGSNTPLRGSGLQAWSGWPDPSGPGAIAGPVVCRNGPAGTAVHRPPDPGRRNRRRTLYPGGAVGGTNGDAGRSVRPRQGEPCRVLGFAAHVAGGNAIGFFCAGFARHRQYSESRSYPGRLPAIWIRPSMAAQARRGKRDVAYRQIEVAVDRIAAARVLSELRACRSVRFE
ncbi:MAG: ABC transporter substrate-binding protein [Acetobacteraceae bacterium]